MESLHFEEFRAELIRQMSSRLQCENEKLHVAVKANNKKEACDAIRSGASVDRTHNYYIDLMPRIN